MFHKHALLSVLLCLGMISCSSGDASKAGSAPSHPPADPHAAAVAAPASGNIDPVCGMVRDSTWTEYALHKGDTFWFCAAIERKAFVANPDKYLKQPGK